MSDQIEATCTQDFFDKGNRYHERGKRYMVDPKGPTAKFFDIPEEPTPGRFDKKKDKE